MDDDMDDDEVWLHAGPQPVACYRLRDPQVEPTLSPRPYLHPVRTLAGTVVTDTVPDDHRWHLGASLAVQDVSGTNLWGGRTYVRDTGYTWRDDHGRIEHVEFTNRTEQELTQRLRWCDPAGATLLSERRQLRARPLPGTATAWVLDVSYELAAPDDREIVLGSPATNGRPGGAGYGGFFWRAAAPAAGPPLVYTATAAGEEAVNGSTAEWVALADPAAGYTLVFAGLAAEDRWFVRARQYPGVCAAFAFDGPRAIPAGAVMRGAHAVVVADGEPGPERAGELARLAGGPDAPGVAR